MRNSAKKYLAKENHERDVKRHSHLREREANTTPCNFTAGIHFLILGYRNQGFIGTLQVTTFGRTELPAKTPDLI